MQYTRLLGADKESVADVVQAERTAALRLVPDGSGASGSTALHRGRAAEQPNSPQLSLVEVGNCTFFCV